MYKTMTGVTDDVPQRSRPWNGGNTTMELAAPTISRAATEPAGDQREHGLAAHVPLIVGRAAMEPPSDRLEHLEPSSLAHVHLATSMEPAFDRREHIAGICHS